MDGCINEDVVVTVEDQNGQHSCCVARSITEEKSAIPGESGLVLLNRSVTATSKKSAKPNIFSYVHIIQTGMHIILTALGFLIMLAVMTFNVWVFLSVILGVGIGYFVSGHLLESPIEANSCCM